MENLRKFPLCGLVLAGGRSIRMGQDKASMIHPDGRPLARRAWDLLHAAGCETVVLSLRDGQPIPPGFEDVGSVVVVARDADGEKPGPLTGIVSGMLAIPGADWLVTACDLPGLEVHLLSHLIESRQKGESFLAYASASDGQAEPLCAYYAASALELLENEINGESRSLRTILCEHQCRLLKLPTPSALDNSNTPEEWASATASARMPEMQAELLEIWISPGNNFRGRHERGQLHHPVEALSEVQCIAGQGLRGDRYFGYKEDFKGQVTFFQAEALAGIRERFAMPELSAGILRRNLIVRGASLGEWAGRKFLYQGIIFEGSEECKPCYWMDQAVAVGAEEFLKQPFHGGLRARILTSGTLRITSLPH